ncbi:MAG: AMP-binding protein [Mariniblastus sp.]|nr:AMP-binding protein [Mariniblastus sp.]
MYHNELSQNEQSQLDLLLTEHSELPAIERWRHCTHFLRGTAARPSVYRDAWQRCFVDWSVRQWGPAPMWSPGPLKLKQANLSRWADFVGVSVHDFQSWSVEHRAQFWADAVERLGIDFSLRGPVLDDSEGPEQARWFPEASLNIVSSCFLADPEQVAIVSQSPKCPLKKLTYQELRRLTNQISNSIVHAGFLPGDALAVFMPMTQLSVAIYLGIVQAGCAVVSVADSFAPPEIETRLRVSRAKAVLTYDHQLRSGKALPLFQRIVEATDLPAIVIGCGGGSLSVELRPQDQGWTDFLQPASDFEPVLRGSDDPINILFSSGTTGEPKAIPWTQLTPIKCAVDGHLHQDIDEGQVCVWPTNLGWMMGPWLIFASLLNRGTIGLYEDAPVGPGFGKFIQDAGVTMLGVVPTIVKAWRESKEMEDYDWSKIAVFSSTGESSQRDDMFYLSALARMKPVIEYCGGTEIGGGYVTSVVTSPNVPAAFNSPAMGLDFVILDEDDHPAESGEVFLIPPSIGLSSRLLNRDHAETYYSATPQWVGQTALRRHGDHFQVYPSTIEGHSVWMAGGRVDDTMNLGGIKTSSAEIERVLNQAEGVRETAAVAVVDNGPSELAVFVVLEDPLSESNLPDLQRVMNGLLKTQLNPLFRVNRVVISENLPRTASGKVMRRSLRDGA